jgi:hypothetical protein
MVNGRICLFKKNAEISRWVSSRAAIIYTINGQSHGALPNDFSADTPSIYPGFRSNF